MDKRIEERFNHVYWSIYLYNSSLNELQIISDLQYNQSELRIANSHTFNFYRITLQYCFIMEYNKLLEVSRKNNNEKISSLFQLNKFINSIIGKEFESTYYDNEKKLLDIKQTEFYKKVRALRDKKFAHADNHELNIPFNILGFKSEDFINGFAHLQTIKELLLNCTSFYDFEFALDIPQRELRTKNFIQFQAKYHDFYRF